MNALSPVARLPAACTRRVVRALTTGFDAMVGPVGRLSDRIEAHLAERTTLLRAYYSVPAHRRAAPLPILEAPIDLAMRGGMERTDRTG